MDLRPFIPLAPAPLRPVLQSLAAWMARSDTRLEALEAAMPRLTRALAASMASNDARLEALERAAGITPPPKA